MNSFIHSKNDILIKYKSAKGIWDERVIDLCNLINSSENYYTTSSCSGKASILEEKVGKDGSYYLWTSHKKIILKDLQKFFYSLIQKEKFLKFKFDSPVIFVVCSNINSAVKLLDIARKTGFKESGIIITKKIIGLEIRSCEKLEFPIFYKKILVEEDFLKEIVKLVNSKLELGWKKLDNLKKEIEKTL